MNMNPTDELLAVAKEFKNKFADIMPLPKLFLDLRNKVDDMQRRALGSLINGSPGQRTPGKISDDAARALASHLVINLERSGHLGQIVRNTTRQQELLREAGSEMGVLQRWTGQTTTEFPLPAEYGRQVAMLISDYGVVRNAMRIFPMRNGTAKPPRHKTGMTFGSVQASAQFSEKNPAFEFASLEGHKIGGIVITPRELFDNSLVEIGTYLAEIGASAFAQAEDTWGFLADGSGTYESVKGVCKIASDNSKVVTLDNGETSPDDVTLEDLVAVLALVSTKARNRGAWYMNNSWEAILPRFNTAANQYFYRVLPDGRPLLLGKPIVWTEVLQGWTTDVAAGTYCVVFGDLKNGWWMGEAGGGPRIDNSNQFLFDYDQIATRFIEEIDFDYVATDAVAALKTAAS
jgi:HK97 family phage major capsid protein